MGIKLKWFRHRLNFDSLPTTSRSSSEDNSVVVTGFYRRSVDFDGVVDITRPKELPPIKARKTNRAPPIPTHPQKIKAPSLDSLDSLSVGSDNIFQRDVPPPLPLSPPPQIESNDFEEREPTYSSPAPKSTAKPPKKTVAPPPPPLPVKNPTEDLPIIPPPKAEVLVLNSNKSISNGPTKQSPKAKVEQNHSIEKANNVPKPSPKPEKAKKVEKPPQKPPQKPSKFRSIFGLNSSPDSKKRVEAKKTQEKPKPSTPEASKKPSNKTENKVKVKRIRVPKETKAKELKKSASNPEINQLFANHSNNLQADSKSLDSLASSPSVLKKSSPKTPSPVKNSPSKSSKSRKVKLEGLSDDEKKSSPISKKTTPVPKNQVKFADNTTVISDNEDYDSWDLVAKHRASINQVAQVKNSKPPSNSVTSKHVEFLNDDKPKTMREMRKSQSVGAGHNLKNKVLQSMNEDSDTEV